MKTATRKSRWTFVSAPAETSGVAALLNRVGVGDPQAVESLFPVVYDELRCLAARFLGSEPTGHTLQPTALVHEAYLRLVGRGTPEWSDRKHFFATAARAMRRILVDHARRRRAAKRGGDRKRAVIDEAGLAGQERAAFVVAVHDALSQLADVDRDQARIVELRFFGGLTVDETAGVLGVSSRTINREWLVAKAWLHREITREQAHANRPLEAGEGTRGRGPRHVGTEPRGIPRGRMPW